MGLEFETRFFFSFFKQIWFLNLFGVETWMGREGTFWQGGVGGRVHLEGKEWTTLIPALVAWGI